MVCPGVGEVDANACDNEMRMRRMEGGRVKGGLGRERKTDGRRERGIEEGES